MHTVYRLLVLPTQLTDKRAVCRRAQVGYTLSADKMLSADYCQMPHTSWWMVVVWRYAFMCRGAWTAPSGWRFSIPSCNRPSMNRQTPRRKQNIWHGTPSVYVSSANSQAHASQGTTRSLPAKRQAQRPYQHRLAKPGMSIHTISAFRTHKSLY